METVTTQPEAQNENERVVERYKGLDAAALEELPLPETLEETKIAVDEVFEDIAFLLAIREKRFNTEEVEIALEHAFEYVVKLLQRKKELEELAELGSQTSPASINMEALYELLRRSNLGRTESGPYYDETQEAEGETPPHTGTTQQNASAGADTGAQSEEPRAEHGERKSQDSSLQNEKTSQSPEQDQPPSPDYLAGAAAAEAAYRKAGEELGITPDQPLTYEQSGALQARTNRNLLRNPISFGEDFSTRLHPDTLGTLEGEQAERAYVAQQGAQETLDTMFKRE